MFGRLFRRPLPVAAAAPAELIEAISAVPRETAPIAAGTLLRLTDRQQPLPDGEAKALARHIDPQVRQALAGRGVAAPIAEYSPLLSDDDLLEIIKGGVVIDAVARRAAVSERVADAVVASSNLPAVAALLANTNAQLREETLDAIIDQAGEAR